MTFKERFKHSLSMQQKHAVDRYNSYFDADGILEIDCLGEQNAEIKKLDFSGIDKIIIHGDGYPIHIAQRFRREYFDQEKNDWAKPDFSLRVETYDNSQTEYDKLKAAYYGNGSVPSIYAFGIHAFGRQVAKTEGFIEFHLIDLPKFLELHYAGEIKMIDKKPNGDGSMGMYFDLDVIQSHDCVIESWGDYDD